ncbi:MAG: EF-P beta-lysylation protein EpmB [Planctomycetaceae bacterium]
MTATATEREPWQQELVDAIRDPKALLRQLSLPGSLLADALKANQAFRLMVTRNFLQRMKSGDVNDPLLRQVLPVAEELETAPDFVADPLQEADARKARGLVQKYTSRALLIANGNCAINCRYCFRREYPYESEPRRLEDWQPAFDAIADDTEISEVILSGGDPLMLSDSRFSAILDQLESIQHLRMLRIHSRLPIVLPSRITDRLKSRLLSSRLQPVLVVHSNHPNEIVGDCETALRSTVRSGIPTLNQTVLLKQINDNAPTLIELSKRLTAVGVMPYYLHQLDHVSGTAHFEVEQQVGRAIISEMRKSLPGYAVPRFVVEEPGEPHKTVIV